MTKAFIRDTMIINSGIILASLIIAGCAMSGRSSDTGAATGPATGTAPATAAAAPKAISEKGGAELWGQTCGHCHNIRSPSSYGPAQWEVIVYDMRVRANLTGEEQRKITEFLKAASQ
jgi:cytochrome c5